MSQIKRGNDQTFAGIFLIGLAILFITNYWWPGIMFVIGIAMIARTVSEGRAWNADRNALVVIGIGLVFAAWDFIDDVLRIDGGILWPVVLILVGIYLLFGQRLRANR